MDVAITAGKIARVADTIPAGEARRVVDVSGLFVTPGLVDIHVHVYNGADVLAEYSGDRSLPPDGFTFRSGVTTVVDLGSSGWRSFADFKTRVIDRSRTRVLAFLNIVGRGMAGGSTIEQNTQDMDAEATAKVARQYPEIIVGVKTAHFSGHGGQYPGRGRFRQLQSGASVRGAGHQTPASRRLVHAHVHAAGAVFRREREAPPVSPGGP
jgi:dihydroorotase